MQRINLLPLVLCISLVAACAGNTDTANANANTGKDSAKKGLKPGDVTPDKPVDINELADSVAAASDQWIGKEVTTSGYVGGAAGKVGDKGYAVTFYQKEPLTKRAGYCKDDERVMNAPWFGKTVHVKGTIAKFEEEGESRRVHLKPCEVIKVE